MSDEAPRPGSILREAIRNWPTLPADQDARLVRESVLNAWDEEFQRSWFEQLKESPYFPHSPHEEAPDIDAIRRLGEQPTLSLFEAGVLIGIFHPAGADMFARTPGVLVKDILRGRIDPLRPGDMQPLSASGGDDLPAPDWRLTRAAVESYAVAHCYCSTLGETHDERESRLWDAFRPAETERSTWPYQHDTKLLDAARWVIETYWEGKDPASIRSDPPLFRTARDETNLT